MTGTPKQPIDRLTGWSVALILVLLAFAGLDAGTRGVTWPVLLNLLPPAMLAVATFAQGKPRRVAGWVFLIFAASTGFSSVFMIPMASTGHGMLFNALFSLVIFVLATFLGYAMLKQDGAKISVGRVITITVIVYAVLCSGFVFWDAWHPPTLASIRLYELARMMDLHPTVTSHHPAGKPQTVDYVQYAFSQSATTVLAAIPGVKHENSGETAFPSGGTAHSYDIRLPSGRHATLWDFATVRSTTGCVLFLDSDKPK